MKYGRFLGGIFLVLGIIVCGLALAMASSGYILKVLFAGPPLSAFGLALCLFPGSDIPMSAMFGTSQQERAALFQRFVAEASTAHKVIWGGMTLVGLVAGFVLFLF